MRSGIFITARTDSTRLPRKILRRIRDRAVYNILIDRAMKVKNCDEVVFCTTMREEDDQLSRLNFVKVFRGDCDDKIHRWLSAAKTYDIDYFINYDGDDLLCGIELMEQAITLLGNTVYDYIKAPDDIITGAFTFGIKTRVLEKIYREKTSVNEMTSQFFNGIEKTYIFPTDPIYLQSPIRLTLDYEEDLYFFTKLYESYPNIFNESLYMALQFLKQNPHLVDINYFREKDFKENQRKILQEEI